MSSYAIMTSAHPEINPKAQFYNSNGSGRDIYIAHNNGGLSASSLPIPELKVTSFRSRRQILPPAPSPPFKTVRYPANGTGRDTYIALGSGGFEALPAIYSPRATFYLNLRRSHSTVLRPATTQWLPIGSRMKLGRIAEQQKRTVLRLSATRN